MSKLPVFALVGFCTMAFATAANATCPTYHTLTNGSPADATQVMDNFGHILGCPQFTGNIGVGATSPAWASPYDYAVDMGASGALVSASTAGAMDLFENMYWNGSSYIYKTSAAANAYVVGGNGFWWYQAPSGVAGGTISLTRQCS